MKKIFAVLLGLMLCLPLVLAAGAEEPAGYTIGGAVTFGQYEQDNNAENGKEPIEWLVLDIDGSRAFLISKYCLEAHEIDSDKIPMTWSKCELRVWMNDTFLNEAFSPEEQATILTTEVINDNNPDYGTYGGRDTRDQIYLLSFDELFQYFPVQADRSAYPTPYAIAHGAFVNPESGYTYWWLRTPGVRSVDFCGVSANGILSGYGSRDVNRRSGTVRPVLWVEIGE